MAPRVGPKARWCGCTWRLWECPCPGRAPFGRGLRRVADPVHRCGRNGSRHREGRWLSRGAWPDGGGGGGGGARGGGAGGGCGRGGWGGGGGGGGGGRYTCGGTAMRWRARRWRTRALRRP